MAGVQIVGSNNGTNDLTRQMHAMESRLEIAFPHAPVSAAVNVAAGTVSLPPPPPPLPSRQWLFPWD